MKTRSKAVLWLLLAFIAGIGFGTLSTLSLSHHLSVDTPDQSRSDKSYGRGSGRSSGRSSMMSRMLDQLDLDETQADQIQGILESGKVRMEKLEKDRNKEHHKIRKEAVSQIREVLRPDQQENLDAFIKQFREDQKRRRNEKKAVSPKTSP